MESPWAKDYSHYLFPPTFLNWLPPFDGSHIIEKDMAPMKVDNPGDPGRIGPHPSFIQVAKPYIFEQAIQKCIQRTGAGSAKEENIRLMGIQWIDNVRRALKLPVRTFDTAAVYYHKFRLAHADSEFAYVDAAAAALFTACKIEDTLKKSRDILCAAYNLKVPPSDQLSPDDALFEHHSRTIIGLERLMLEASGFDFRNRHPQVLLIKLAKKYGYQKTSPVVMTAYCISLDLYRTYAPLKQTTPAMAFACLELAGRLHKEPNEPIWTGADYSTWNISRAEVMETVLDLLELYTHNRSLTSVGPEFSVDTFLEIRIPLNQEVESKKLPRYTEWHLGPHQATKLVSPSSPNSNNSLNANGTGTGPGGRSISLSTGPGTGANGTRATPRNASGSASNLNPNNIPLGTNSPSLPSNSVTSPASSMAPMAVNGTAKGGKVGDRGRDGTVRFMLNPEREREERAIVNEYFADDEDPPKDDREQDRERDRERERERNRDRDRDRDFSRNGGGGPGNERRNTHNHNRGHDHRHNQGHHGHNHRGGGRR